MGRLSWMLCAITLTLGACSSEGGEQKAHTTSSALSTDYVAAYGFSEGSGTTTVDASTHHFNGTLAANATWSNAGKFDKALSFTGASNSYVQIADDPALRMTNAFTLSAWVKPTSLSGEPTVIFKQASGALTYALYAGASNVGPNGYVQKGSTYTDVTATTAIALNTWTHLATTYDGTSFKLYVNGVLTQTSTVSAPINSSTGVLRIGNNATWSNEGFVGLIDEVRLFNRAESATEIQADMAAPVNAVSSAPTGSIAINGGEATKSTSVTLSLSATDPDGVSQMRLSNDGVTFGSALAYSTSSPWTLTSGDGVKTVYVQYQDSLGNWSTSFSDTITLDSVPPTLSAVAANSVAASSAAITWATNESASSTVNYGTATSYGSNATASGLAKSHTVSLAGLSPSTLYHYRVRSTDAAGNEVVGSDATFTTTATPAGATIVSNQHVIQTWGQSTWATSTISVTGVQAGDAIIALGLYWVSSGTGAKPVDQGGQLLTAVNQITAGYNPPVAAQIFYEFNASTTTTHTITPPNLAYGGDGIFYVLLVRGLSGTLVTTGNNHATGTALTSISTQLAANALSGDFVLAIGGEDDEVAFGSNAGMSGPPSGWSSIGAQQDSDVNVPSSAFYRIVSATGTQPVTWTWNDNTANVTTAAIAAFR